MGIQKIDEIALREGAKQFEFFWLRPKRYADHTAAMRLRINKKWGGWKLKDELVESLSLEVGDTISTEVTPYFMNSIIDDNDDTDLFASGSVADWLLDNGVGVGTVIDCIVRFVYTKVPVGVNGKCINKVSLVMEEGIEVVGVDEKFIAESTAAPSSISGLLQSLLE